MGKRKTQTLETRIEALDVNGKPMEMQDVFDRIDKVSDNAQVLLAATLVKNDVENANEVVKATLDFDQELKRIYAKMWEKYTTE